MGLLLKRSAKTRKGFIANSLVLSKQFDLGDPTMFKKYSQCSITYKIKGSGVSPVRVRYKVDNEQYWQTFENEIRNSYGLDSHLKKTGNENRTAQFKFKNNTRGRKLTIELSYYNVDTATYTRSNVANDFKLVDISYTFRGLKRD